MTPRRPTDEHIEIEALDGDESWWSGDEVAAVGARDHGAPKRTPRTAIVAVVAALAAAVAVAVVTDDTRPQDVSPTTTTPDEPVRPPVTPGLAGAPVATRGVLLDAPGWTLVAADNLPLGDERGTVTRTWRDDTGPVVLVQATLVDGVGPSGIEPVIGATPLVIDGVRLAQRQVDGAVSARLRLGSWDIRVEARGVDPVDLARFVGTGQLVDDTPEFDGTVLGALDRVASRPFTADTWLTGAVVGRTEYVAGDGTPLTITVGLRALQSGTGVDDVLLASSFEATVDLPDVPVGAVRLGELIDQPGVRVAQWVNGEGQIVTLTTRRSVDEMIDLVASARRASRDEWAALRASEFRPIRPRGSIVIGSGTTSRAVTWQAGVQQVEVPGDPAWRWWWTAPAGDGASWTWLPMGPDDDAHATTVVYPDLTYVLVSLPVQSARGSVVVSDPSGDPRVVTPTRLSGTDRALAVTAVETDGPFRVFVTDGAGQRTELPPVQAP